tara:strand:+ start:835 stop:1743 length:909 start_codon:yes stop_codon:yes gene_type:complete
MNDYPRDLIGYAKELPKVKWPNNAKIAIQFVLNYEEGGENNILHGDKSSETFLSEIIGAVPYVGARHMSMESLYEYGSRSGVWRILKLFKDFNIPITIFAVAMALKRNPLVCEEFLKDGHEICSHGLRWINYHDISIDIERSHMQEAIEVQKQLTGERPLGWYTGRTSENTRKLVVDEGGFLYDSDDYSDDLPFWSKVTDKNHLIIPYTLDVNDMRFTTNQGFNSAKQFFQYLKNSFDILYKEGSQNPKMMSVGLHCRLIGKPGRFPALEKFIKYVKKFENVWFAKRIEIAKHWRKFHPYKF